MEEHLTPYLEQFTEADITLEDDGSYSVEYASFKTLDAARRFVVNKAVLDNHLRELLVVEDHVERMLAVSDALRSRTYSLLASVAHEQITADSGESEFQLAVSYLAVEQRKSQKSVEHGLDVADSRREYYPASLDAWCDGTINSAHMRVIERAGQHLNAELRETFEAKCSNSHRPCHLPS